ncbi:MAG: hypothetical protein ACRC28_14610 [Clostridium sp.]|uniref:hypothetical protein n=1 Tax=Clostridium sp. TaxID=1506 RepID=UPI003F38ED2E
MRKIITILGIFMSIVSAIVIICTFLTSYQFVYIGEMFNTYFTLQVCLCITMGIWAIKFWIEELGMKKYIYTLICIGISLSSIFFIASSVR